MIRIVAALLALLWALPAAAQGYPNPPPYVGRQATGTVTAPVTAGATQTAAGIVNDVDITKAIATQEYAQLVAAYLAAANGFNPAAPPAITGTLSINGAVNSVSILGGAFTNIAPTFTATGTDANVSIKAATKGAGCLQTTATGSGNAINLCAGGSQPSVTVSTSLGTENVRMYLSDQKAGGVYVVSNGVTGLQVLNPGGGTTGMLITELAGNVSLSASDAGPNADVTITAKGTGVVRVQAPAPTSYDNVIATTKWSLDNGLCVRPLAGLGYAPPHASETTTAPAPTTQVLLSQPIPVCGPLPGPVTAMAVDVVTAPTAATQIRLSLYADNGVGKPNGPPLIDSGIVTVPITTTGVQIVTLGASVTLPGPGVYWLTYQGSATTNGLVLRAVSTGGAGGLVANLGYSLTAGTSLVSEGNMAVSQTGTFGAPPSPYGAPTGFNNSATPIVLLKF